jgi:hypothetical protein
MTIAMHRYLRACPELPERRQFFEQGITRLTANCLPLGEQQRLFIINCASRGPH